MKTFLKPILWIVLGLVAIVLMAGTYVKVTGVPTYPQLATQIPKDFKVEITPERIAQGAKIVQLACYDCHVSDTEQRLSGKIIKDMPTELGIAYSKNITKHPEIGIGKWTDAELAYFLRTGVRADGSFAPPYMPKFPLMSDVDLKSVIAFLRSDEVLVQPSAKEPPASEPSFLTTVLTHTVAKPYPFNLAPAQPPTEQIAFGKYLSDAMYGCTNCHSADFKKNNDLKPTENAGYCGGGNPLLTLEGEIINSANISPDVETGIGNWTPAEFLQSVKYGKGKNGQVNRYPMLPKAMLDSAEVMAIYAYLKTVPPIKNKVNRELSK
jgi:cytochrome c2